MRNNILRKDLDLVIDYLKKDDPILTNGKNVLEFEKQWSDWLGVKHSVFINSGSSANLLSMAILKNRFPDGGDVIVPPLTWVSDIAAVLQNGFRPVFADIDKRTLGMDTNAILDKINQETRAVFITHVQGFNALTDKLLSELEKRGIPLIEDVCESHGATHNGRKLGSFGWMSNFSFYYAHHMSTIEGGMVCTNDYDVYQALRMFRSHGLVRESTDEALKSGYQQDYADLNPEFIFAFPAYNVRNTEIGGILGLSQLERIDWIIEKRTENLAYFLDRIDASLFQADFALAGSSNYAFNLILKEGREHLVEKLMTIMKDAGIEFRRGSAGGGNQLRQPYLKDYLPPDFHLDFPNVEHIHFYGFYIGNYPDLDMSEIDHICNTVNSVS